MTAQELIERLEQIEDKTKEVRESECGYPIDDVLETDICVYL